MVCTMNHSEKIGVALRKTADAGFTVGTAGATQDTKVRLSTLWGPVTITVH